MKNSKTSRIDFMAILRSAIRLALFVALVYVVHQLISWIMAEADGAKNTPLMVGVMALVLLTYILLISIPFVPGIEIALSLMVLNGSSVIPWIYSATIIGLFLAFLAGQYLSYGYLRGVFWDLHMKRACALLDKVQPLSRTERLGLLKQKIPHILRPLLVDGRYALIAVLLNIPGNAVIGGGGGILFIAGLSRLFSTGWIILTLIVAVAPLPIAILVFGIDPLAFMRTP